MALVNWLKRHFVVIAGLLTLGYLLLPNVVVTVFSFNKPKGRFNYEWQQFSTDAWKDPCGVADMCGSLSISLQIAFWATVGATVLGSMIAFALVRSSWTPTRCATRSRHRPSRPGCGTGGAWPCSTRPSSSGA